MSQGDGDSTERDPSRTVVARPAASASAVDDTVAANPEAEDVVPEIDPARLVVPSVADFPALNVVDPSQYLTLHEIARGGMGRIQLARDRRLGRDVAIKEVLTASGSLVRRFEREARITARLEHPSIVNVYEAGVWPSGEPFYAMRLISGRGLDEVMAAAKTFNERLALVPNVLAVADAMAYAHGEGVIHRDLKPSNVIVGAFGETVVIDWGLVKELRPGKSAAVAPDASIAMSRASTGGEPESGDDSSDRSDNAGETSIGDVLGTPAYMPPEQALGRPVDERADVYAIGAILYHLLAGRAPFVAPTDIALLAAVVSAPPPPITEAAPDTPNELVAIVERAMARDLDVRYPTAAALADDLRRFQTGQLVGAHRYSSRELLRRWVWRHRTAISTIAAAAIVALVIGIFAVRRVVAAEHHAQEQRSLAVANQANAEDLMRFMVVDLRAKLVSVGRLDMLDEVSHRARDYYDRRADSASDSESDAVMAATVRGGIAEVLEDRGAFADALVELGKSRALIAKLEASAPDDLHYHELGLHLDADRARIERQQGDLARAQATSEGLLASAERLLAANHDAPALGVLHLVYLAHSNLASIKEDRGDLEGALADYRLALAIGVQRPTQPLDAVGQKDLLNVHANVGRLLVKAKHDPAGALAEYRIALAIGEQQVALDPKGTHWPQDVVISHNEIGSVLESQHDLDGALDQYGAAREMAERFAKVDPANTRWLELVANANEKLGTLLLAQHQPAKAIADFDAAHTIWIELTERAPSNHEWQRALTYNLDKLGDAAAETDDYAGALRWFSASLPIREKLVAADPSNATWQRDLFYTHFKLAAVYSSKPSTLPDTLRELRLALAITERLATQNPTNEGAQLDVTKNHGQIAVMLGVLHDRAGALAEYGLAIERCEHALAGADPDPEWQTLVTKYRAAADELRPHGKR